MNVLFIGDVVGKPGRRAVRSLLPGILRKHEADFIIANGENLAAGFGLTGKVASEMFEAGVDVITTGNHVWDRKEAVPYLMKEDRVLRPLNYPSGVPGVGSIVRSSRDGVKVAVLNVSGRVFMPTLDCPFAAVEKELQRLGGITNMVIVDFHAEATSEKIAFGYFLDGRVSAVVGTHTHVQTADEKILPGGTAYITDVGMTGPAESVIGMQKEAIIERFLRGMPQKFEVARGPSVFSALLLKLDEETGRAVSVERVLVLDEVP
jgi:metallophosphoesterase (TIGR00282 family)